MSTIHDIADPMYLAKTDMKEQQAQIKKRMEAGQQIIDEFDVNHDNLERSYAEETDQMQFAKPEDDVRLLDAFWKENEMLDLAHMEKLQQEAINWINDHEYEL